MNNLLQKTALLLMLAAMIVLAEGCCNRSVSTPEAVRQQGQTSIQTPVPGQQPVGSATVVERPADILENTGLNYSIDGQKKSAKAGSRVAGGAFEKQYLHGVELMEKGEFTQAIELFDELIKRYPNTEEASIAELCIAELYFRNKSNDRAMQAYERIVANYPQSHAAENARAGIAYLKNFQQYEQEYVSPDVEARKRRGY
ncbi:MAG TPA: tetratricopeptide repeat protein [Candidatus Rifleibacterium sp.]|nr:tetratricopeptide repeat protein [Candidatus Rifleibacterium sp.]HPT45160.1 tetratricopeptide repeat protein [Candidatus Rifleibacterium sp.]